MCQAERICKLSVCIKIRGFVRPSASVHQSRGTYSPTSASQHFRLKEKEEGFPKGGTLVHLFGSVRSTQFIKPGAHFQGNKCCRSEQASREKQPVKAAAAEGGAGAGAMGAGCRAARV